MQKAFFASGFLYHSSSQQILLQQFTNGDTVTLSLFRGKSRNDTEPLVVFQRCIEETLGVKIKSSAIKPVYDYVHRNLGEHFIFFVEIGDTAAKSYASKSKTAWVSLAKLAKANMSEQTRHDIIIGERVIRSLLASSRAH